jgi:uncharacterized protein (TIGR03437 family)
MEIPVVIRRLPAVFLTLFLSWSALAQTYRIATVAGSGTPGFSGDNGPAVSARLYNPNAVAVDSAGNLYICDSGNARVRKVSNGVITTVAGNGTPGFSGDNGPAASAQLNAPSGIAVDSAGNLYIADYNNQRVRKVSNGVIATAAGTGVPGYSGDNGPAASAELNYPNAVAVDSAGNLYISDSVNYRIREVSGGTITTVVGSGTLGSTGDGGPPTAADLSYPFGVAVDSAGNLYISDSGNERVREVSGGVINTIAGNGTPGFSGDGGPAASAQLADPEGVAVDSAGNVFISDFGNNRIRKVSGGVITTLAGNGAYGFSGDNGPPANAELDIPEGIAVDSGGNVYIADFGNNRIRELLVSPLSIAAVANAASNLPGPISPGEIVVLYGSGIGPAQLVKAAPGGNGYYGAQLANASVLFNGIAAPMIYTWATQAAAIVPYEITGTSAQVTVTYQGQTSAAISVPIASSAPGVFTLGSTGFGQAAAINQDGITVNTAATPASVGDIIALYATGEGQTTPAGVDGKPASYPYPYPNLTVTATVGGQNAAIQYAGGAPGLVAGLMQVNVKIPAGIATGNAVPVVLRVGNVSSPPGVTIAVR